jgi:hypothetical protein
MAKRDSYRKLNPAGSEPREISEVVNNLIEGKTNNTGTITLNVASATTTTISDARIGYNSVILLMPTTANAVSVVASTYISATNKGNAVITHTANTNTDKTYKYIIVA